MNVAKVPLLGEPLGQHAASAARLAHENDARRLGLQVIIIGNIFAVGIEKGDDVGGWGYGGVERGAGR